MTSDLHKLTVTEARTRLRTREISATELTRACLDRMAAVEPGLQIASYMGFARTARRQTWVPDTTESDQGKHQPLQ